ncbi:MAG: hypothetical protein Q7U53_16765 [Anaerolineaceae bacterium]|nr:hypothetical protein [Anaerolineaceae bacterium]
MNLTPDQYLIAQKASKEPVFLSGLPGSGKSTTGKAYLELLINNKIPGNKILILVPQKSLGLTYTEFFDSVENYNGSLPTIQTMSGISQKIISLFWPIIANQFDFSNPKQPPTFLNIESAQYFMSKVCEPFFDKNYFSSIKTEKPRILSQILDNLNKSALVGFLHEEISIKLKNSWNKDVKHLIAYDEAQECANAFRNYCYQNNLLDFSLKFEVFTKTIQNSFLIRQFLFTNYDYFLYDNCEEDTPVTHDLVLDWLPHFQSSLIIFDTNAGYRSFLGADPKSALRLGNKCSECIEMHGSFISDEPIQNIISLYKNAIHRQKFSEISELSMKRLSFNHHKFYPDMINIIVEQISEYTHQGIDPGKIAVLAPFISNALRFQLQQRMEEKGIKIISHRPSRSLREESIALGMIAWIKIAYPEFGLVPSIYQLRTALHQAINNIDPIRADLLSRIVLSKNTSNLLRSVDDLRPEMAERITLQAVMQYQQIYTWLSNFQGKKSEVDVFIASFFGELLSQPGFGLHQNYEAAEIIGKLIESMQNFRNNTGFHFKETGENWAQDYISMLENGLISALYLQNWDLPPQDAVYLAPAHTFLMQNRPVEIQFWLDIGNLGWWQRLMQPLTQPFVLSRNWVAGSKWTDIHEYENNQQNLDKLITGLLRRNSGRIILHTAGYNENGDEQAGPLLKATQRILRAYHHQGGVRDV